MLCPATASTLLVQVLYLAEAQGSLTLCVELTKYVVYFFALYILLRLARAARMPERCVACDMHANAFYAGHSACRTANIGHAQDCNLSASNQVSHAQHGTVIYPQDADIDAQNTCLDALTGF